MLVNLTPNWKEIKRRQDIAKENNIEYIPQCDKIWMQYGDGVYQCNFGFNFSQDEFLEFEGVFYIPREQSLELFAPTYHKTNYGVADSIEQIKEYYKEEVSDLNRKYIITATPVFQEREKKGKGGGWRWEKWGEYIGKLESKCQYLDDEDFGDDFKYVICFNLYEIK